MKRVFDMNYDRWAEACGSESYKTSFWYVDLSLDERGSKRYYLGYNLGDMDALVENPIKNLSGQDFDHTNFEDLYSEEQLDELNGNLQEIFRIIRDQFEKDASDIIREAFDSACDSLSEYEPYYADSVDYDASKKLLTILASTAHKLQEGTYWAFDDFAKTFVSIVEDELSEKYGSNFNAQSILSNEVGKTIATLDGFKIYPPNIVDFVYNCRTDQANILNKFRIESDSEDSMFIEGHAKTFGKSWRNQGLAKDSTDNIEFKVIKNIDEADNSVKGSIASLNYEIDDISDKIMNEGPLDKDNINQRRFAIKLKMLCRGNNDILRFVDISSIVKNINLSNYLIDDSEELEGLKIDKSKVNELIKSAVEEECSECFKEWIEEPYTGFENNKSSEYYFKFSVNSFNEEISRNLNTKIRLAVMGICNCNDELVKNVYKETYDKKKDESKIIEVELFDILDFDSFFNEICSYDGIDFTEEEYDKLYKFTKDLFSKVKPLEFKESEFIQQSRWPINKTIPFAADVTLECFDINRHSVYYD